MGNNNNRENEELEILHIEPELKEFVRRTDGQKTSAARRKSYGRRKGLRKRRNYGTIDIPEWVWKVGEAAIAVAAMLLSLFVLKIPTATVFIITILEFALAACLSKASIRVHGAVILVNIILGMIFHMAVFMLLESVFYIVKILMIYKEQGKIGGY